MNKSDLVDALADATGMTKADAGRAIDALFSPDGGIIAKRSSRSGLSLAHPGTRAVRLP